MFSYMHSSFSRITWRTLLAWIVTASLVNPFAILLGAIAGFVIVPPDLGPFIGQPPSEPPTILLARILANSIVAGSLVGISQWRILRQFASIRFWVPVTIIGFAFGMAFFYLSIDKRWMYIPGLSNLWLIIPAIAVAISQAFLLYREGYTAVWWLLAGEASIATSFFGSSMGNSFDSFLEQSTRAIAFACLGALFSAIVLLMTFRKELAHPKSVEGDTT